MLPSLEKALTEQQLLQLASLAELGLLTASMVHEIRQPLFSIKANTQLARAEGRVDDHFLRQIENGVEYIEEMLSQYGGFGQLDRPLADIDLRAPVQSAVDMLHYRARQGSVRVDMEMPDTPVMASINEGDVRQVIANLLSNALDAVDGSNDPRVSIQLVVSEREALLTVRDSGSGVSNEVLDSIFRPFVTTKPAGKGTGLGLFVARQIVQKAGGRISLAGPGVDGLGAQFQVVWPLTAVSR